MVPSLISWSTDLALSPVNKLSLESRIPTVFVSRINFSALSDSAIEPATRSAFMLYEKPSLPTPIGAITGIKSPSRRSSITEASILSTFPT